MSFEIEDQMEDVGQAGEGLDDTEASALEPQLVEIPEVGEVVVSGDPFKLAEQLDDHQGDNIYHFGGDCGLVTVSNILTIAGIEADENDVVGRAIDLNLCHYSAFGDPSENGGTSPLQRRALLESYGIPSVIYDSKSELGSPEAIARYVEAGHGVNISTNAGYEWNEPAYIGNGCSNHSITVTGTARDPETGELKGLFVCDSGLTSRESGAMFLSVEVLQDCYVDPTGTTALVTTDPIR